MDKNKLGIVINTTKANNRTSGFRPIYNYNSDEWSSIVRDTGAELKKVTNNSNSDPIHLIQFVSNGCCYCIMQSIAGRKDYQSAWIFIHKDINLPKGELSSVIKKIEEILSLDVEDKKAELNGLFSKTYPTSESPIYPASSGDTYAVRYYGEGTNLMYTENHILGDYLYQSDYCRYKSVFLINKSKGQIVADATDISDKKLQKSIVIELLGEIDGFKHNLGSDSIRVTEGTKLKIRWTRSGYAPIDKEGKTAEELKIKKSEYKKSFRLNLFRVIDKVTREDLNVRPKFVGEHWVDDKQNPKIVFFKEEDLTRVSCHVDKATYHSFADVLDLTRPNGQGEYVIELQPEEHIYNCYISTNIPDNRKIKFVIKTQHKLRGNEIPGFKFDGDPSETRENKLKAAPQHTQPPLVARGNNLTSNSQIYGEGNVNSSPRKKIKKHSWYKYAIYFLFLLFLLGVFYLLYEFFSPDKPKHENPQLEEIEYSQNEWGKAYDYLSRNNAYWTKSEMESYSELKGVYALIKDYQFNELKSFIDRHQDLINLDPWKRLYEITKKYNNKKGTFKSDGDKIDIEEYLETDFDSKEDVTTQAVESDSSDTGSSSSIQSGIRTEIIDFSQKHSNGTDIENKTITGYDSNEDGLNQVTELDKSELGSTNPVQGGHVVDDNTISTNSSNIMNTSNSSSFRIVNTHN